MNPSSQKIKKLRELSIIVKKLKKDGKKIVHCHGVFDLIHPGHIRYFHSAKKFGDVLVVTATGDQFVKRGPGRPVFHQDLRTEVLAAIELVDYVAIVEAESPIDAIRKIKPDFYVKGPDSKRRKHNKHIPRKSGSEEEALRAVGGKLIFTDDIVFSSSHLINQYLDVYPPETKAFIDTFRKTHSDESIIEKLLTIKKLNILVIGDAIIDQYCYSVPLGKSTKEPITVHKYLSEESFAGGTLGTANHLAALSNNVTLVTILGAKKSFESFVLRHMKPHVKVKFFFQKNGSTIVKRRFIDEFTKQKLFQITYLRDDVKLGDVEKSVVTYLKNELPQYDLVIVNDFGHGFLTKKIIRVLVAKSKFMALNVQANSANYGFNVITKYPRADYVCIDEMELRLATHNRYGEILSLMKRIYAKLRCGTILATRGPYGAMIYTKQDGLKEVPALTQKVVDRVGAGDVLFAVTSPCVFVGMEPETIAFVGNVASALKIQTVGNKYPIDFTEMAKFITRLLK